MTTGPIRIFIDCEFSDLVDMHLIAIACITHDGREYYAELDDFPRSSCNEFVQTTVLPLLGRIPGALGTREQVRESLQQWLNDVRAGQKVLVAYDYFGDWTLLVEALAETPEWLRPDNVRDRIDYGTRAEYHARTGEPAHHALYDARSLRHAYRPRT